MGNFTPNHCRGRQVKRDNRGTQDNMRTKPDRVLTASQQAAEKRPRNGEPTMNAGERRWNTNALSAFIGGLKWLFPDAFLVLL